jgi:hypothetical protein
VRGDEAARSAIELPENTELAHLEERAATIMVDEHVLEGVVQIV